MELESGRVSKGAIEASTTQEPTDRFIVRFKASGTGVASALDRELALNRAALGVGVQAKIQRRLAVGAEVVRLDRRLDADEAAAFLRELQADPAVEYAHVDRILKPAYVPNDPLYASQWHYFEPTAGMNLPKAWDKTKGSGVVVAVLDTGQLVHPDMGNVYPTPSYRVVAGYDFIADLDVANDGNGRDADPRDPGDSDGVDPSSWHGTHVAGTVAARTNNGVGVAGVAPSAKVMPVRVLGVGGGYTSDIADAIIWASGGVVTNVPNTATPAEVINMSLGGQGECDPTTQAAIDGAVARGTVVVVAAGNDNSSADFYSPASCDNVITVGSMARDGTRSYFSNAGKYIDVVAPGGGGPLGTDNILSTLDSGTGAPAGSIYAYYQGTSMASPHVAGVVALMQARSPNTPAGVELRLKRSAIPVAASRCWGGCGAGRVDANAAVAAATTLPPALPVALQNGVAMAMPSTTVGGVQRYKLQTFAGLDNLRFTLSGGTGNPNLYVKFGSHPTTASYDCRSIGAGTTETCDIGSPQVGTYYVLVDGAAAFSGASVKGSYTNNVFANGNDTYIRDLPGAAISSSIFVHGRPIAGPSALKVNVKIYHTYAGDLTLTLLAPDGTQYPLQSGVGGGDDNIVKTFTVDVSSETTQNGTWRLRALDGGPADVGHIDYWQLTF